MEIDGYILFHTTDHLADALPLPPVETATYINDKKKMMCKVYCRYQDLQGKISMSLEGTV